MVLCICNVLSELGFLLLGRAACVVWSRREPRAKAAVKLSFKAAEVFHFVVKLA